MRIRWTNQDNSPLQGDRFTLESSSPCLSKLVITKKQTDHHRTWKCQVDQNDQLKVVSYTSTITGTHFLAKVKNGFAWVWLNVSLLADGLEEVFAAVGESVSLPCSSNFSFTSPSDIKWTINDNPLTNSSLQKTFQINKDSLVINKVNSLHAGDYQCSESSGSQRVLNRVRLHTLDGKDQKSKTIQWLWYFSVFTFCLFVFTVTEEFDPEGENLNLTCILTCAEKCEADFNLTWSERNQNGLQSSLTAAGNTLTKRLLLPFRPPSSQEILCSVQREGALMTSKKWPSVHRT